MIDNLLREKVATLDGSRRGTAAPRAAVRISDLAGLFTLPASLKAGPAAGSTPTAAEYDALRADVEELYLRMQAVAQALQVRIL